MAQAIVAYVDATVVVPTRDRHESLARTLRALASQLTDREWELVVFDDGSSIPVPPLPPGAPPRTRVLRGPGGGPAQARNRGWRAGTGEIVVFTDDDVEPDPVWLDSALRFLATHPEAVGVEGPTRTLPYDRLRGMSVESHTAGGYLTANIAFRRSVLERLGGFHEGFPAPHCEDYDLAFRASELGTIGFEPAMRVLHHPRALSAVELGRRGRLAASEVLLFERHRERYGRIRRIPPVVFPFVNAVVGWGALARREVRSPQAAARWLGIFCLHMWHLAVGVAAYARRQTRLT